MAKVIHKYELTAQMSQSVNLPKGSVILSVGEQKDTIVMWAAVPSEEKEIEPVNIKAVATGSLIYDELAMHYFVGTVQMKNGLVFHIFRQGEYGDFKELLK